jgi:cell cycle checkpoint protein
VLYGDSPIDTSLYSLYLHQNYYQFCAETDECEGVIESLSLIDSLGDAVSRTSKVVLMSDLE